MTRPLAWVRALLFASTMVGWYALWLLAWPAARVFAAEKRWTTWVYGRWARFAAAVLCLRVRLVGEVPPRPFLLVSNHLGYLDMILLGARLPVVFVAKAEVARWPVFGPLARQSGTLFVDRTLRRDAVRASGAIEEVLRAGRSLVLFPEGTSTDGADRPRGVPWT